MGQDDVGAKRCFLGGLLSGGTLEFRFLIFNIFSLRGTGISSKPVSHDERFVQLGFHMSWFHCRAMVFLAGRFLTIYLVHLFSKNMYYYM